MPTLLINIFHISAAEVARNELSERCREIRKHIEEHRGVYSFVFIETPPSRWEHEVQRQMKMLESHFEGKHPIHPLILPSKVYKEMQRRNSEFQKLNEDKDCL